MKLQLQITTAMFLILKHWKVISGKKLRNLKRFILTSWDAGRSRGST